MGNNDYRLQLAADLSDMEKGLARITNQLAGVIGGLNETDAALKRTNGTSKQAADSQTKFSTSLNSTRYALYDVSRTLLLTGAALLAFGLAPTKVAIDFQREFANVQRTVEGAGQGIKDQLKDLATQIPVTFKDLTVIATLGGQLGEGKDSIVAFTETVAKLTATAAISSDVAGTALGRFEAFGLVTSKQFNNLASAILKVGVNSVATDQQIITISTRIAGIGKTAGLSAATLIGYAGALASVGIQAYGASGSTIRLIQKMQEAVNTGGEKLQTFAKVAGVSTDDFAKAFGTEKFNPIFQSFISNLGNVGRTGKDVNLILKDLGLSGAIDSRTFTQLAAAHGVVLRAFNDAESGYKDATELNKQYGRVAETTAAKIQEFGNSILNLMDTIGSQTTGPLGAFVSMLIDATKGIESFISTPVGQAVALIVAGFATLAGVILITTAVAARATASFIGLTTAITGMDSEAARGIGLFSALNAELAASNPLGAKVAAGLNLIGVAVRSLALIGGVVGAVIGASAAAGGLEDVLDKFKGWSNDLQSLIRRTTSSVNTGLSDIGTGAAQSFLKANTSLDDFSRGFERLLANANFGNEFGRQVKLLDDQLTQLAKGGNLDAVQKALEDIHNKSGISFTDLLKNFPALKDAALQSSIGIRASSDSLKIYKIEAEKSAEATKKAAEANAALADQTGNTASFIDALTQVTDMDQKGIDKWIQGYQKSVSTLTDFNSIVKSVQDSLSANAQAQADAAGGSAKAADFYNGASVTLAQFTDQLNANNNAQITWAQNLLAVATQYGPAAAQQFIDAGYSAVNSSILQQLVNASPEQAQAYIDAQVRAAQLASDATATAILTGGYVVTASGAKVGADTAKKMGDLLQQGFPIEYIMAQFNLRLAGNPMIPHADTSVAQGKINNLVRSNDGRTVTIRVDAVGGSVPGWAQFVGPQSHLASGGYVTGPGTGTSDSINARLSAGEYVIKASAVRQLGVPYLDSLNGGRTSRPGHFADGGPVTGNAASGIVELGASTLNAMRGMMQREITIAMGNEGIARAANSGNKNINRRGGF